LVVSVGISSSSLEDDCRSRGDDPKNSCIMPVE